MNVYEYYCDNRLGFAAGGSGFFSYHYDLLGRRIRRLDLVYSEAVEYVWDGEHIIAEYENGSLTRKYIYGPGIDNPVAMLNVSGSTETRYYYYTDALGSVRLITNAAGAVVEGYSYDPFGKPTVNTTTGTDGDWLTPDGNTDTESAYGNRLMFTGRDWDAATGIYYYRFRDYHPTLGRFLQPDPLGYWDSANLYQYCFNSPINFADPYGLGVMEGLISLIGGGGYNPGMEISPGEWGEIGNAALEGAGAGAAMVNDSLIPFFDPFSDYYTDANGQVYDWCASGEIAADIGAICFFAGMPGTTVGSITNGQITGLWPGAVGQLFNDAPVLDAIYSAIYIDGIVDNAVDLTLDIVIGLDQNLKGS